LKLFYPEKSLNFYLLAQSQGSFKRDEILDKVWGKVVVGELLMHIRKLREKIERNCLKP
jgi:DNA-binding response OmpR family regulator